LGNLDLFFEPSTNRVAEAQEVTIDQHYIIPGIPQHPQSVPLDQYPSDFYQRFLEESIPHFVNQIPPDYLTIPAQPEAFIDPAFIIPSISDTVFTIPDTTLCEEIKPPQYISAIDEIPALPVITAPPELRRTLFSVPVIDGLDRGRYYIQLLAGSQVDGIESEIKNIGSNFPVTVQNAGSEARPLYRLLVGPVNLGESGALLERFKRTYKDAFVRYGG
jgi:hypothetical protein